MLGLRNGEFCMILTFELNAKLPAKWAFLYLTELTRPLRDPNAASRTQIHAQIRGFTSDSALIPRRLGF